MTPKIAIAARSFCAIGVVSIGTTSAFPYIAWPFLDANRSGKYTIEINPSVTGISQAALLRFPHGAADTLGALAKALSM